MLPSYFDYSFVRWRQKARLRPDRSPKFLLTLSPNPARTRREKPGSTYNCVPLCKIQCQNIRLRADKKLRIQNEIRFTRILMKTTEKKGLRRPSARITWLGGRKKFGGCTRRFILWMEEGHGGTKNLSQSGSNEQGEDQKFRGSFRLQSEIETFFRPKTGDLQKKRSSLKL